MGESLIPVFKRLDVFELPLPPKPHVWSGNFPLVCAFLSCCWAAASSGFTKSPGEKQRRLVLGHISVTRNNLLILFSPTTSKAHEESHEKRLFSPKSPCPSSKQRSLDGSHELGK